MNELPSADLRDWTLRGVRVLDPATGRDETVDLSCAGGRLAAVPAPGAPAFDGAGLLAMPAAIDPHVHFRQPGGEDAETVASGLAAAARGGVGTVVAMPNTVPPLDTPARVREQFALAAAARSPVRFLVAGCCTVGRAGLEVAPLEELAAAGAVAFSDDGAMVARDEAMRETMRRAAALGRPVMDHAVVPELQGAVRDGALARSLGLRAFPDEAETRAVARDLALAGETGAHIHLQHLSAGASADLVAAARARGVRVSAEATPHHLLLACEDIPGDDASWKMNPPLGTRADRARLRAAVLDGTVDCFATDHAPHPAAAKARGFAAAPFGVIGLETALAATWQAMVAESGMRPLDWCARWTLGPASALGLPAPALAPGAAARVALLRFAPWTVRAEDLASKSSNTPMLGRTFPVRPVALLAPGSEGGAA